MIDKKTYEEATASGGDFVKLIPGCYPMTIVTARDEAAKEYVFCEVDIISGDFAHYAADTAERAGFWPLKLFLSYKPKAAGIFKRRMKAIESTNRGFTFDYTAEHLVGKYFYGILGEEEYRKNNGGIGTRMNVTDVVSIDDYNAGKYTIPETKKLAEEAPAAPTFTAEPSDTALPWD